MPKARVYQPPGNVPAIVVYPYEGLRNPGESDDDFLARMMARYEAKHPEVGNRPSVDVEASSLPARGRVVAGERFNVRRAWRIVAGTLVVDETKVHPLGGPPGPPIIR